MRPSLRRVLLTQVLILVTAMPGVLLAASASDDGVIRNWSAPSYFQPAAGASNGRANAKAGEAVDSAAAPEPFVALSPCRLADTRPENGFPAPYGPPALTNGITRDFAVAGHCGVPVGATAVSFNFTVVRTQALGYLATYPEGESWGGTSTLNYVAGSIVANNAAVALGASGALTVFVSGGQTDLIIDINGYYGGAFVSSVNGLDGDVDIVPGNNVTITPSGNTLVIDAPLVEGPMGPMGPQGSTGAQGAIGPQGAVGPQGAAGAQGAVGPQGAPGAQGAIGPQGTPGLPGAPGAPGTPGAQGDPGAPGASMSFLGAWDSGTTYAALQAVSFNGSSYVSLADGNTNNSPDASPLAWTLIAEKGATGNAGADGAQGPAGATGATGAIGPQGPVGATGAVGPQGPVGNTGTTGAVGPQGAIGPQGIQGPIGPQGIPGQDGVQGIPGTQGVQGASLSFAGAWDSGTTYSTLQVVSFDGSGYVSLADDNLNNSPDSSPLAWSLIAERGTNGDAGADGAQGPVGPQGPVGNTGATGATGPIGPQGPVGATGAQGPVGATGAQGPVGNTGATGAVGPQGVPGLPGAPGATGGVGPQGPVGPQGVPGPAGSGGTMFSMKHDLNLSNAGGSRYFSPINVDVQATEDFDVVGTVAKACSMTTFLARVDGLSAGVTATLTLRKGATIAAMANTALTCNLTSAILSCTSNGAVAMSAGDLFDLRLSYTAGDGNSARVFLSSLSCD